MPSPPAGWELLHRAEQLGERANAELMSPLSPAEQAELKRLVERLIADR